MFQDSIAARHETPISTSLSKFLESILGTFRPNHSLHSTFSRDTDTLFTANESLA